jgi:hypothetical protein
MIIIHPAGVFLRFYENSGKIYSKVRFYDRMSSGCEMHKYQEIYKRITGK